MLDMAGAKRILPAATNGEAYWMKAPLIMQELAAEANTPLK